MANALFFEIPSKSKPGKVHIVRLMPDGEWRCGCWPFLRNKTCRHVEEAKKKHLDKTEE